MPSVADRIAFVGYALCYLCMLAYTVDAVIIVLRGRIKTYPKIGRLGLALSSWLLVLTIGTALQPRAVSLRWIAAMGFFGAYYLARRVPRRWPLWALRVLGAVVGYVAFTDGAMSAGRAQTLGNPNMVAGLLVVVWPWWKGLSWEAGIAGGLLGTQSRGGLLAVLLSLVTAHRRAPGGRTWRRGVVVAALVALVVGLVLLVAWRPSTLHKRAHTWTNAARLFAQRPLAGWGPGSYGALPHNEPSKAHADNALLTVLVEQGVIGGALWLWLAYEIGRAAWRSRSPGRWAVLSFGLHQLVDDTLAWPWVAVAFGLCLGLTVRDP